MLITVSRSGGFTGADTMRKIDTSVRRDAAEWEGLARRAVRPVADGFHYRITIDGRAVDVDEAALTDDQRDLIRAVLGEGA
ncbi:MULTISPECIES: protealysin inhibitor emfourin [unclassified Streptomyces]|uniref:protealysin inhibitor emfourin n=1 Tax=unclassified Streptomyces TaxID=2593676 RepID=UPI003796F64F